MVIMGLYTCAPWGTLALTRPCTLWARPSHVLLTVAGMARTKSFHRKKPCTADWFFEKLYIDLRCTTFVKSMAGNEFKKWKVFGFLYVGTCTPCGAFLLQESNPQNFACFLYILASWFHFQMLSSPLLSAPSPFTWQGETCSYASPIE